MVGGGRIVPPEANLPQPRATPRDGLIFAWMDYSAHTSI
jgi:hypothetical protein